MLREVIIPSEEFTKNQIHILSMNPVSIEIYNRYGEVERIETNYNRTIYEFATPLDNIKEVIIKPIPGIQYSFLPAIKAL